MPPFNHFIFGPRLKESKGRVCPTLALQSTNAVIRLVCAAVSKVHDSNADMKLVRSPEWMDAKALIHVSLSDKCIEEIYSTIFLKDCTVPRGVVTHSGMSRIELCEHEPKKTINTSKMVGYIHALLWLRYITFEKIASVSHLHFRIVGGIRNVDQG